MGLSQMMMRLGCSHMVDRCKMQKMLMFEKFKLSEQDVRILMRQFKLVRMIAREETKI